LFSRINDKFLTDIDFSDLNHTYTATDAASKFTSGSGEDYSYLLPYSNESEYALQQLKPAIFAKTYLDRIFASAGKKFTHSDTELLGFRNLIIPYNGDNLKVSDRKLDEIEVKATKASQSLTFFSTTQQNLAFKGRTTGLTEVKDLEDYYNPTTGEYESPTSTGAYSGTINYEIKATLTLKLDNQQGEEVYAGYTKGFPPTPQAFDININTDLVFDRNLSEHQVFPLDRHVISNPQGSFYILPNGVRTLKTIDINVVAGVKDVDLLDKLIQGVRFGREFIADQEVLFKKSSNGEIANSVVFSLELTNIDVRIVPSPFSLPSGFEMDMNTVVPSNIKQSDFLKSILRMYNAYLVPTDENTYKITTRDVYYDEGAVKDWTFKIDLDKERTITFVPELTSKEVLFTYKPDDKDVVNDGYTKATNNIYGQQSFIFSNQYARGKDTQELLFSPTPHALSSFGAYLPMINGFAPKNNIRILLHNGRKDCQPYTILDTINSSITQTHYPEIIHLQDPLTASYDINFGICDFYFYNLTYFTPNTLFNRYYLRQMNQINTGKLMSAYFNLSPSDIRNIKLNDKIKVGNTLWNINKVIDYDANSNSVTKVELISADDGKRVNPQTSGGFTPSGGGGTFNPGGTSTPGNNTSFGSPKSSTFSAFERQNDEYTNLIYGDNVDVKGRNNYIVGNNIILIGDNNTILADNVLGVTNNSEVLISNSIIQDATVIPAGALMDEFGNLLTDENGNILTT
jgi:hypothetical protein